MLALFSVSFKYYFSIKMQISYAQDFGMIDQEVYLPKYEKGLYFGDGLFLFICFYLSYVTLN